MKTGKSRRDISCGILAAMLAILALGAPASAANPVAPIPVAATLDGKNHTREHAGEASHGLAASGYGVKPFSAPDNGDSLWWEIIAVLLGVATLSQLVLSSVQTFVTRKAADAANRSAQMTEHLVASFEAPFLFPVLISDTIENAFQLDGNATRNSEPIVLQASFTIMNFGRSPALLQKVTAVLYFGDIDDGRNDPSPERETEFVLAPQGCLARPLERKIVQPIENGTLEAIREDNAKIFLRGRLTFLDVQGNRFEQTFCFAWNVATAAFTPWGPHRNRRKRLISKRRKLG